MLRLPLWNEDESDVLPEYQLTFGHVVCDRVVTPATVKSLGRYLGIGSVRFSGEPDVVRIPVEPSLGHPVLQTESETHLLVAEANGRSIVFGPHRLFFSSDRWRRWNRRSDGLMAYVTQVNMAEYHYIVFQKGRHLLRARADGSCIAYVKESPVRVYVGGKLAYRDPCGNDEPSISIDELLRSDARIAYAAGSISISMMISQQPVDRVTHYIFSRNPRKWYVPRVFE